MRLNTLLILAILGTSLCYDWRKYVPSFVNLDFADSDTDQHWNKHWQDDDSWESDGSYGDKVVDYLSESLTHYGPVTVRKDCTSAELRVYGSATIRGDLKSNQVTVTGPLSVSGTTTVSKLTVTGTLNVDVVRSDTCTVIGHIQAKSISAKSVELKLNSASSVTDVAADSVFIKTKNNTPRVQVGSIVGKNIVLHNVSAKNVRGENVTLVNSQVESLTYHFLSETASEVRNKQKI